MVRCIEPGAVYAYTCTVSQLPWALRRCLQCSRNIVLVTASICHTKRQLIVTVQPLQIRRDPQSRVIFKQMLPYIWLRYWEALRYSSYLRHYGEAIVAGMLQKLHCQYRLSYLQGRHTECGTITRHIYTNY